MAEVHHISIEDEKNFEFSPRLRQRLFIYFGVGLVLFIVGILLLAMTGGGSHDTGHATGGGGHEYHWIKRVYANLWMDTVLFNGIALVGVFFVAVQYVAYAGWSVVIRRIPEAFGYFLPITGTLLLVLFLVGGHDIFHWTHSELYDPNSPQYDEILDSKKGFLNTPFYLARMVIYFVGWFLLFMIIRRNSLAEDNLKVQEYRGDSIKIYNKNVYMSAVFIVFFAVTSSTSAWDWLMSIDPHWFSTMYGWYTFASIFVSGLATITLTVILLKEQGYLKSVNENHLHDLGKFMFAFSIFWTYIWFSQFLLYYYANIPEEVVYFADRMSGHEGKYVPIFYLNLLLNFVIPFLTMMTRDSKRTMIFLKIVAISILMGHWVDFYMMVMPGTVGPHAGFGLVEIGALMMFVTAFIFVFATNFAKANIIPKKDPYLKESMHHVVV